MLYVNFAKKKLFCDKSGRSKYYVIDILTFFLLIINLKFTFLNLIIKISFVFITFLKIENALFSRENSNFKLIPRDRNIFQFL